jgi:hypothetical protein
MMDLIVVVFAHAVAAEQGHDLAGADLEGDVEQHLGRAVGGLEVATTDACIQRARPPRRDRP